MKVLLGLLLLGFEVLCSIGEAFGFKLCDDVIFYSLNNLMCSVAILLWICCVSAAASAHECPLYVDEVYLPQVRKGSGS